MKKISKFKKKSTPAAKATKSELPDLIGVMLKVAERLEALEKKMEIVIAHTSVRFSAVQDAPRISPSPVPAPHPAHPGQVQNQGPRERVLHKAVCADCKKDCEVPFKPSGERPVYCKECFKKRRTNGTSKPSGPNTPAAQPLRQVRITPNGAGKVTVSEVRSSAGRHPSSKKKQPKPFKRSKRS
jgi:CxxC-x17-CxxC domain-containing protein